MSDWFWLWLHLRKIGWRDKIEFEGDVEVYSDDEENWYEHFKWILYLFIIYLFINYHQIFLFIYFLRCQFDVFEYLYVCIVIYYSSIHVHFYSGNVRYESVVELIIQNITSLGALLSKCVSQEKKLFQT